MKYLISRVWVVFGEIVHEIFDFQGVGLVVCGDDEGSLWLYNLPTMVQVGNLLQ